MNRFLAFVFNSLSAIGGKGPWADEFEKVQALIPLAMEAVEIVNGQKFRADNARRDQAASIVRSRMFEKNIPFTSASNINAAIELALLLVKSKNAKF
jgi:hypothetical protein